jgi:CubicO group peptidase (beta-lactamase class C family)
MLFLMTLSKKKITLRQLLCHNSGLSYDIFHPLIMNWRDSRQETPLTLSGTVVKAHSIPLVFEPGEGWIYGGGVDLSSLLGLLLFLICHFQ